MTDAYTVQILPGRNVWVEMLDGSSRKIKAGETVTLARLHADALIAQKHAQRAAQHG
jgi:hypothetical protein